MDDTDIFQDTISLFGGQNPSDDDGQIRYGPLVLTTAPKEGKANTLLAGHLFSPSLFLAEHIERGLIPISGKSVLELGAGCALPSLLCSISSPPASTVVITDYPDDVILGNLHENIERNKKWVREGCVVKMVGYEWGQDVDPLLSLLPQSNSAGFDVLFLSDLLHFPTSSHTLLLSTISRTLLKSEMARVYVSAGKYTSLSHCESFLREGERLGLTWDGGNGEEEGDEHGEKWMGNMEVRGGGLDREQLGVRKGMCRWWVGRWADVA